MRVVSGEFRGRNLKTLKGDMTRPTTMRVKESLFSSLTSTLGSFENVVALDGFAGSGGLGIEVLSRGAKQVVFFEKSKQAAQIIRENLAQLQLPKQRAILEVGDSFRLANRKRSLPFNLVLLDPPYALSVKEVFGMIEMLDQNNLLAQDALVYYEMSKINKSACCEEALRLKWGIIASKDFGDTSYVILGKGN